MRRLLSLGIMCMGLVLLTVPEAHAARRIRVRIFPRDTAVRIQKEIVTRETLAVQPERREYTKADYHLRNERRRADLITIANAIFSYKVDNQYQIPSAIKLTPREICRTVDRQVCEAEGLVDLSSFTHTYLEQLPVDPTAPESGKGTGYTIHKDDRNKIHYTAPNSENLLTVIKMSR